MLRLVSAILALGVSLVVAPLSSRQADAVIVGVVLDSATRKPVSPSRVDLVGTPRFALGDELGRFILGGVAPGEYRLLVRGILYFPETLTVRVEADTLRLKPILLRFDARTDSIFDSLFKQVGPGIPATNRPEGAATVLCGGYEDVLAQADRPLTPCEIETPLRLARALPVAWPTNYSGPCQFVEVRVVVDSLGKLEPGSPWLLRTNVPGVASNVLRQMSEASYLPGLKAGKPVRSVRGFYFGSPGGAPRCER
jgi:hypothetical protein